MNRTLKDATVRRYYYDTHDQLRGHLGDFLAAYNFARRLKTLRGLTPYEYICKIFTSEPQRFRLDPLHQMPGLNILSLSLSLSLGSKPVHKALSSPPALDNGAVTSGLLRFRSGRNCRLTRLDRFRGRTSLPFTKPPSHRADDIRTQAG